MKPISALKNTTRLILFASLMCGTAGLVHAQAPGGPALPSLGGSSALSISGPGQAGGMGEQGAPALGGPAAMSPGGPEQVGGMGVQGALAEEFPGRKSAIGQLPPVKQRSITNVEQGNLAQALEMRGRKGPASDALMRPDIIPGEQGPGASQEPM